MAAAGVELARESLHACWGTAMFNGFPEAATGLFDVEGMNSSWLRESGVGRNRLEQVRDYIK